MGRCKKKKGKPKESAERNAEVEYGKNYLEEKAELNSLVHSH